MILRNAAVPQSETSPFQIDIMEIQTPAGTVSELAKTPVIILITGGSGELFADGTVYGMAPGRLLLLSRSEHTLVFSTEAQYIRISAEKGFFREFLDQNILNAASPMEPADIWTTMVSQSIFAQFTSVIETVFSNPLFTPCNSRLGLHQLFIALLSATKSETLLAFLNNAAGSAGVSPANTLLKHLGEELTGDKMSKLTNMSFSSLNRYFRKKFNATPSGWIKRKRLEKARNQLLLTRKPVTEIAMACGFKDSAHFSRTFKSEYGISPVQCRKTG